MASAAVQEIFAAIADPTRRRLLERIGTKEMSVADLTAGAGMTMAAVSLHLQVLRRAGLVHRRIAGRQRLYRLDPLPLRSVSDWTEKLTGFWNRRLDRLQRLTEEHDAEAE